MRMDGRISLKNIGDVDAVGFTLTQLADYLRELYATMVRTIANDKRSG